jgi:hypothetical protein
VLKFHGHLPALCSSRLCNLAVETDGDEPATSTPVGLSALPQHTLPGSKLLSEVLRDSHMVLPLASYVFRWLRGRYWRMIQMSPQAQQSLIALRHMDDQLEQELCIAFASSFQPSCHLASVPVRWIAVDSRADFGLQ